MKFMLIMALFAFLQTPPPGPGQAPDSAAHTRQNIEGNTKTEKAPAAPPEFSIKENTAQGNQSQSGNVTSENKQEPIRVGELPPVSVTKDWTDRAYWVFSGLLVIVGALQIWLLFGTMKAIRRQADLMERQTVATETAANAAKTSAEAATKNANTAELAMKVSGRADLLLDGISLANGMHPRSHVILQFKNFGHTRAKSVLFDCHLEIPGVQLQETPIPEGYAAILGPMVIGPNDSQSVHLQPFINWLTEETFRQILEGAVRLRFQGQVTYNDVFDDSHKTHCSGTYFPETQGWRIDENYAD